MLVGVCVRVHLKAFKIPKIPFLEKLFTDLGIPCGGRKAMTSTCEEINECEMDSFSIDNYRRESTHCFYQNRGKSYDNYSLRKSLIYIFSYYTVIQPLLTGKSIYVQKKILCI